AGSLRRTPPRRLPPPPAERSDQDFVVRPPQAPGASNITEENRKGLQLRVSLPDVGVSVQPASDRARTNAANAPSANPTRIRSRLRARISSNAVQWLRSSCADEYSPATPEDPKGRSACAWSTVPCGRSREAAPPPFCCRRSG